ncbi:23S rRNA (adenine-N6)-dimethyltransferase [Stackebrandtia albiflava]|uniref:23S rRNA (Adenine-N6)-dimethyltransferase n=1 Tax=Stackebrandtia albiflava TaxID=406432 RepID=A0A562VED8_9ACTN|nr:ErmE/ErmH/ErmO/ErmR family 23S rRNA (adenine(2058)-N(6))-methyltransferase [Stackebrandtia albiflava]TWJ16240.1 23S rRNA (adenine-N6)-dimethyltransferase [Stackebrandtia albiflava]
MARRTRTTHAPRRTGTRRSLSQNFLTDPATAAFIVRLSKVGRDDLVVEPGPGRGILTRALLRKCGRVDAYELDGRYAARLSRLFGTDPRMRCMHQDFLTAHPPREPFSVVANIPYSRTSAIVDWCLSAERLRSATLVTQWEFARKRTGDYGRWSRLTVLHWPRFDWRLEARIDRHRFDPVPRVDSGVLRLVRRPTPLLTGAALADYRALVTRGFTGVGGDLFKSLRPMVPTRLLATGFRAAGISPRALVSEVRPDQWVDLVTAVR